MVWHEMPSECRLFEYDATKGVDDEIVVFDLPSSFGRRGWMRLRSESVKITARKRDPLCLGALGAVRGEGRKLRVLAPKGPRSG